VAPAKRPLDDLAHLVSDSHPKRRAFRAESERVHQPMWSTFAVDEKKAEDGKADENKVEEPLAETVDSELARWFAQNPPDNWSADLATGTFSNRFISVFFLSW